MDYVDVPRLNDVPVAATVIMADERMIGFKCSNLSRYIFKFNELNELEYCTYYGKDKQKISSVEEIPDFDRALDMANDELAHIGIEILAR